MHRSDEVVAGECLQVLAEVDDEGAGRRRHVDPLTVGIPCLQTADAVLGQDGDEASIVVAVDTRLAGRRRRVVNELGEAERSFTEPLAERAGRQRQRCLEQPHQLLGHGAHPDEELVDEFVETRQHVFGQPLVRSVETEVRRVVGADRTGRVLGRHVELLAVVDTVVGELGPHTLPPAEMW